jgi:hypothetical protein
MESGIWDGAGEDLSLEAGQRLFRFGQLATHGEGPFYFVKKRVTERARDGVLGDCLKRRTIESLVEIIRHRLFELRAVY